VDWELWQEREREIDNKSTYSKNYYEEHKHDILARANQHSKTIYGQRLARELNKNKIYLGTATSYS
jgi:hypothetical protein